MPQIRLAWLRISFVRGSMRKLCALCRQGVATVMGGEEGCLGQRGNRVVRGNAGPSPLARAGLDVYVDRLCPRIIRSSRYGRQPASLLT